MHDTPRGRGSGGGSVRIGFESDAVRHTAPRPRRTAAATRALPAAYVRGGVTPYDTPGSWHFAAVSVASDGFSAACAFAAAPRPPSGTTTCNRTVARDRSRRTYAYTCRITSRVGADLSSRVLPKAKAEEHSQPTTVLSAIISRDSTWRDVKRSHHFSI